MEMHMPEPTEEPDMRPKSAEYQNFEAGLKQVLSVSKEELARRLQADKEQRASKKAKPGGK